MAAHIASEQNPRLKALRRLRTRRGRERSGTFMVEGEDLVAAAQRAGRQPIEGFHAAGVGLGGPGAAAGQLGQAVGFHEVDPRALARASTLGSGTRVIGVYEQRWGAPAGPLCVYLHGVGDPGNVGTILRSAHAFGASSVGFGPGCADPHSPKAVRASMGAIFCVALAHVDRLEQLPGELIALDAHAPALLEGPLVQDGGGVTLLVGAEREGLPAEVIARCRRCVRIPIEGDSLNAAMAATVALYEMRRRPSRVPGS